MLGLKLIHSSKGGYRPYVHMKNGTSDDQVFVKKIEA